MSDTPLEDQDNEAIVNEMLAQELISITNIDPETINWKSQGLPIARVKKIMKSEEMIFQELEKEKREREAASTGVEPEETSSSARFMLAGETPIVMQKACEFLIKDLALRSWRHTEQNRRRTVQRTDVHAAVGESEMFDFLIDLVPRVSPPNVPPARATTSVTSAAVPAAAPPQAAAAAAVGVSTEQQSQDTATAPSDAETRYAQLQEMQNQMHEHYTMMQQRAQAEQIPALPGMMTTTAAAATTTHAPAPVVEGQTLQPQVVLNPQLVIHPPQGAAMPQWQPASNGATAEDEATNDPLTHHAASEL